jgi:hypothetical protein
MKKKIIFILFQIIWTPFFFLDRLGDLLKRISSFIHELLWQLGIKF